MPPEDASTASAMAFTATKPVTPSAVISGPTRRCDRASEKYFQAPMACQTVIIAAAGHKTAIGRMNDIATIVHVNAIGKAQKKVAGIVVGPRNQMLARRMPAPKTSADIAHVATAARPAGDQSWESAALSARESNPSTSIITLAAAHAVTPASTYGRGRNT